jgi:hypothetical protein
MITWYLCCRLLIGFLRNDSVIELNTSLCETVTGLFAQKIQGYNNRLNMINLKFCDTDNENKYLLLRECDSISCFDFSVATPRKNFVVM